VSAVNRSKEGAGGTTHITLIHRGDWLSSMVGEFLDAAAPDAE